MILSERDWTLLIRAIRNQQCTPFLGAGACYGTLPLGGDVARAWAEKYGYPFADDFNLMKVAQFLAVEFYPMFPKDEIVDLFKQKKALPDFANKTEPHRMLADLPLPVYMTTNYDHFMTAALEDRKRDAKREICRWNQLTRNDKSRFDDGYEPTVANPVVFHLHGHIDRPPSIVLTEDDYFDFLVNISRDPLVIPTRIQTAFTESSVLFIGYGLADWNFRVLLQGLSRFMEKGLGRTHFAVMLPPAVPDSEEQQKKATAYLSSYYENIDVKVCWASATDFCTELRARWETVQS
jgi:hypothetical protein